MSPSATVFDLDLTLCEHDQDAEELLARTFERALSAVDAAPGETLVVGDSLASDVAGANALGMTSVWVPYDDHSGGGDHSPDHTLNSLAELPDLL